MSFFGAVPFTDDDPRRTGESLWAFFRRSGWDRAGRVRREVDAWLDDLPTSHQAQYVSRLRDADDRLARSTHTELAVHALLRAIGRNDIVLDPLTGNGSRADFLLTEADVTVEVYRASNSDADHGLQRRRQDVVTGLNKLAPGAFWLHVQMSLRTGTTPSVTRLRPDVLRWLSALDPEAERARADAEGVRYQPPELVLEREPDWRITLHALPRDTARPDAPLVGLVEGGPLLTAGIGDVREAVLKKRQQHRSVRSGLLVVVDLTESLTHDDEVAAALYGPVVDDRRGPVPRTYRERRGCVWPAVEPPESPVAVLTVDGLNMGRAADARLDLWVRPGSRPPLPAGPWAVHALASNDQTVETTPPAVPLTEFC